MSNEDYDSDHPEVIRAKAEADELATKAKAEARARVLEARAKLHPVAQGIYALFDSVSDMIGLIGCFLILALIVIAFLAPGLLQSLFGR